MTERRRFLTLVLAGLAALGCGVRKLRAPDAGADAAPMQPDAGHRPSCAAELPPRVAVVTIQTNEVLFVKSDGSSRAVYHFPTPDAGQVNARVGIVLAGGDVFATWTLWGPTGEECQLKDGNLECPETDRLARLDLEGHVLWEKELTGRESSAFIGRAARDQLSAVLPPPSPARPATWSVSNDGDAAVRTNLVTGDVERITFVYPASMRPLDGYTVDHEGSFARVLRNDHVGSAYLSHDGTTWTPLGRTLGDVERVTIRSFDGTYVILADGTNGFFVPTQTWTLAPDGEQPELRQDSVQLLRPATGFEAKVASSMSRLAVTSDGLCAVYVEAAAAGGRFVIHDVARDVRTPIDSNALSPSALTLIE